MELSRKNVIVFLADGFEIIEAMTPINFLRRARANVVTCSWQDNLEIKSAQEVIVKADQTISELTKEQLEEIDLIVIPGGQPGADNLKDTKEVLLALKTVSEKGGLVTAICAGPLVLFAAGLLKGKSYTCYPGVEDSIEDGVYENKLVIKDGNVITGKGPGAAMNFSLKILAALYDQRIADLIAETTFSNESLKSY